MLDTFVVERAVFHVKRSATMRIAVGGDHAGFPLKGPVIALLQSWGH